MAVPSENNRPGSKCRAYICVVVRPIERACGAIGCETGAGAGGIASVVRWRIRIDLHIHIVVVAHDLVFLIKRLLCSASRASAGHALATVEVASVKREPGFQHVGISGVDRTGIEGRQVSFPNRHVQWNDGCRQTPSADRNFPAVVCRPVDLPEWRRSPTRPAWYWPAH